MLLDRLTERAPLGQLLAGAAAPWWGTAGPGQARPRCWRARSRPRLACALPGLAVNVFSPVQAEASTQRRYLTVPLLARACPAACSWDIDSSGILRTAPDHPRKPGGRDHTGVSLADLVMTRPETVRPTRASTGHP